MPPHPLPLEVVPVSLYEQLLPQISVLHRLALRVLPVLREPPIDPLACTVAVILAVGEYRPTRSCWQALQHLNARCKLHSIVCRFVLSTTQFVAAPPIVGQNDRSPSAPTGVGDTAPAICVDLKLPT